MNLIKKMLLPWLFMYLLIPVDSLAMSESEQERLSLERSRSSSSSRLSDFIYSDVSGAYKRECLSIKLAPSDIQPPENIIPITLLQEQRRKYSPAIILSKDDDFSELLPNEILWRIFTFLDIKDLGRVVQVSTRWNKITETPSLWRFMGAKYYGDFLSSNDLAQSPKQQVIYHYLSVIVNSSSNLQEAENIINRYHLNLYTHPFCKYLLVAYLVNSCLTNIVDREELIIHGNYSAINTKINGLVKGEYGYIKDLVAAREFNDFLVEKGDPEAIERKINGLIWGQYGYQQDRAAAREFNDFLVEKGDPRAIGATLYALCGSGGNYTYLYEHDLVAAREFNDYLVKKGDSEAIERKINGLSGGFGRDYGYKQDLAALREFNDFLVEKGEPRAIERKFYALCGLRRDCGYKKDLAAARELNDFLLEKGDPGAIERKINGLAKGEYGYIKDLAAAREINEFLVKKGDLRAIKRKIEELTDGGDDCEEDRLILKNFNDSLVEKGDPEAIERKIEGLMDGKYGYKQDLEALREFNDSLIERGDLMAIERKINGLIWGKYGYQQDRAAAREFNDSLVEKGEPRAIERKIEGLMSGTYGYKQDLEALREFNDFLIERGDLTAIERKRKALFDGGGVDHELMGRHQSSFQRGGGGMPWVTFYIPTYGYKKDPSAAKEIDKLVRMILIEKGDLTAIQEKVTGLGVGKYGYEKNPILAREFIESLLLNETPIVRGIGMYIKAAAMKYGLSSLGYEQDRDKAIQFIRENHVPY